MKTWSVCIAVALVSANACGGGGGSESTAPPSQPPGNTPPPAGGVSVTNNAFSPAAKTVAVGTVVQWAWNTCSGGGIYDSETCVAHSVNFDDGISSPTQGQGTYNRSFGTAGVYNYHCAVHGSAMAGAVTVQ